MSHSPRQRSTAEHMAVPKQEQGANRTAWLFGIGAIIILIALVLYPLWLPRLVRAVVPDRYIVAYAPDFLQEAIFSGDRALPTLSPLDANADQLLIENLASLEMTPETAAAAALPQVDNTPVPTPTLAPEPTPDLPAETLLTGFRVEHQTWNNCGPSTFAMQLSYWGVSDDQEDVMRAIKPDYEDSNVRPDELASYAESIGLGATTRINGDITTLKALIAANFPVVVERGFDELPESGWMGHYMLLVGYNDDPGVFYALDSYWSTHHTYNTPEFPIDAWGYDRLDDLWRHFNRSYIVVYSPDRAADVAAIIGAEMNDTVMYNAALQQARADVSQYDDTFSWNNMGSTLTRMGDYANAATAFDVAREREMPWRMTWYQFDIYEAYFQAGRYEDVLSIALSTVDVENYPESEEGHYYVGRVYAVRGQIDAARGAFSRALRYNPTYEPAAAALAELG